MRILVLSNMYPPHAYGGYEQSCSDVVERWQRAGHEVLVLTSRIRVPGIPDPAPEERRLVWRDLHIYWEDHNILDPPLGRRFLWERDNEGSVRRAVTRFRPDVASAWAMGAMSLGTLGTLGRIGLPVVSVICDEWPAYGPNVDAWLRPLMYHPRLARLVRLATRLETAPPELDKIGPSCFVSDFLRRAVRERSLWKFDDSGIVYSGIATEEFGASVTHEEFGWRLLCVGRIDPRKGIDTVIRALTRLPQEATLEVCGPGDEHHLAELQELAASLGVTGRVTFTSAPRAELARRYAAADVVVFPPVWEEPFGLVPLEAMACGTPVVATAVGGAAEFLSDGDNCLVFSAGDDEALAAALTRLSESPELRRGLVDGGKTTASDFGVDRLAEVLEAWHLYAGGADGASRPDDRVRSRSQG